MNGLAATLALLAAICLALAATLWQRAALSRSGISFRRPKSLLFQLLSLSTGRLVPSVAAVSVANPVVSVMLGALVLQERLEKNPPWHAVVAVGALGLAPRRLRCHLVRAGERGRERGARAGGCCLGRRQLAD